MGTGRKLTVRFPPILGHSRAIVGLAASERPEMGGKRTFLQRVSLGQSRTRPLIDLTGQRGRKNRIVASLAMQTVSQRIETKWTNISPAMKLDQYRSVGSSTGLRCLVSSDFMKQVSHEAETSAIGALAVVRVRAIVTAAIADFRPRAASPLSTKGSRWRSVEMSAMRTFLT